MPADTRAAAIAHVGEATACLRRWLAACHPALATAATEVLADGPNGSYWFQVYDADPETGNRIGEPHGTGYVHADGAIEGLY